MPSEPLLMTMPGTPTSGMPGETSQPAKPVQLVEGELAERDQHRIEAGRVVALGGEIEVVVLELVEIEPGDDIEAGEARADMA